MSNKIVFYDVSVASDHNPRKIWAPNTWYVSRDKTLLGWC